MPSESSVTNPRAVAAMAVANIVFDHQQLNRTVHHYLPRLSPPDRPFVASLVHGVVRWYWRLNGHASELLERPLRSRDRDLHCLLLVGMYQLGFMRVPAYASVSESVEAAASLGKPWARSLLNATLRNFSRRLDEVLEAELPDSLKYSHPPWMIDRLREAWPNEWCDILQANNQEPEMVLRVNSRFQAVEAYLTKLQEQGIEGRRDRAAPWSIRLNKAVPVSKLPGFECGWVSVQDGASQFVAPAINLAADQRVLDACAAPGGKSTHIFDLQPDLKELVAIDVDAERCDVMNREFKRTQITATTLCADSTNPESWWDGRPFDRVIVDAPCSGFGVIRRHPDIKHNRRSDDIAKQVEHQEKLLDALWPLVADEGKLVYTTCSVLPEENEAQIANFVKRTADCRIQRLNFELGRPLKYGYQILPGEGGNDGFYYACMKRVVNYEVRVS